MGKRNKIPIRQMSHEEQRAYFNERKRAYRAKLSEERKREIYAVNAQYGREYRALKKELGVPWLTDEQRAERNRRRRERYHSDPEHRRAKLKSVKAYQKKRKEREEYEGYLRRLEMSRMARKILNY